MSLIIGVKSSFPAMQLGLHDKIRGTWGQTLRGRAQLKFFLGRTHEEIAGVRHSMPVSDQNSYNPKNDEVMLDCGDSPASQVWKARAICKWMTDKLPSHILIVDPLCAVNPGYLWASQTQIADYVGYFTGGEPGDVNPQTMMGPGGASVLVHEAYSWVDRNYLLSKKAAVMISEKVPLQSRYVRGEYDDFWVGQILGPSVTQGELLAMELERGAVVCV